MAKERRKSQDNNKVKEFSEVEKQYIIANFKNETVTTMATALGKDEEEIKTFIADLAKKPGAGLSKPTFARRSGAITSTQVASERGDGHAKRGKGNYQQFSGAIHRPQG